MADEVNKKGGVSEFVSAVFAHTPGHAPQAGSDGPERAQTGDMEPSPAPDARPEGRDAEAQARLLIEAYFEIEDPSQRDAVFEQIVAIGSDIVTEFLASMMHHDEDEYARAAAAAELAKRGVAEAVHALELDLEDPQEPFFFENALDALCEARGAVFFDELVEIWRNPERSGDERREAMVAMERVEPTRAMEAFERFIGEQRDVVAMAEDLVEVAMMAFARQGHVRGRSALVELRERVLAAQELPERERHELVAFLDEGIALLDPW